MSASSASSVRRGTQLADRGTTAAAVGCSSAVAHGLRDVPLAADAALRFSACELFC